MAGFAASIVLDSSKDPAWGSYWRCLEDGRLTFQACQECGHKWLPVRSHCPSCLGKTWQWQTASGDARLVSWVVYHRSYHPEVEADVPYAVGLVQLDEGPRLLARLFGPSNLEDFHVGQSLTLTINSRNGVSLPAFIPA
ncbi:Zn-ribbon domain-containing OB-fold protein [Amorphus sp. 3PC139-8]|uniref:Zn-ribbon domain-containing OB-fold protein n=1 Tax=Amorphus sp. 3PC139-8 TaxID=2735676 RepID=UPI00345C769B